MGFEEDLGEIESNIRRLGVEWEKFFGGIEKKPPNDLKAKVEALLRRHANIEIKNNTERFRYQNLTARYNTMNELWAKRLRAKEEGKTFGMHGLKADVLPPPPPPVEAPRPRAGRGADADVRVTSAEGDSPAVRTLFERFLAARAAAGEAAPVKFDSFRKLISQQASRILSEKGGQAVDFRLETKDGKVSLKAKVVK